MKRHTTAHFIFAATAALACEQASALGFGRVEADAVLGQPLSVNVPVHVDAGERFGGDCLSASVYYGESRLPPGSVRTSVSPGAVDTDWTVRISATQPVSEPVVEIEVEAGCERRFTRRFSVFADPATMVVPTVVARTRPAAAAAPAPSP
ncbi:MAG TPA: hypothetical protein VF457_06300, partial [Burkholderiaceae bacterium]